MKRSRLSRGTSSAKKKRMVTVKSNSIEQRIDGMLKENTGIAMMDSGGASGRSWQQNQSKNFSNEPAVKVEGYSDGDFIISVSTYHFLTSHLKVSPESEQLNNQYKKFADAPSRKDTSYMGDMEEWMDTQFPDQKEIVDIYSEYDGKTSGVVNTYNSDNLVDQTLQYMTFKKDGKDFILLQVHGGADVRGGYTKPQVFEFDGDLDQFMISFTDVQATDGVNRWSSDDVGYHWYGDNGKDADKDKWKYDPKTKKVMNKLSGKPITFSVGWA